MLSGAPSYKIIDSHVHVWKHDPQFPFAQGANVPKEDATPEMLLELMKANGVAKTVIIQVIHTATTTVTRRSVLKQYPQYIQGVARVDPLDPGAPDHLSKLVKEQGFRGVRLSPGGNATGDWIKGPLMPPLWKRCEELKVPMTVLAPVTRMPDVALIEKYPGPDARDRPHGRLPGRPARGTREADRLEALSQGLREGFAHLVAFEAALSLARFAGTR